VLLTASILAGFAPGMRASRIDPRVALRRSNDISWIPAKKAEKNILPPLSINLVEVGSNPKVDSCGHSICASIPAICNRGGCGPPFLICGGSKGSGSV